MRTAIAFIVLVGLTACSRGPRPVMQTAPLPPQTSTVTTGEGLTYEVRTTPTADLSVNVVDVAPDVAWQLLPIVFNQLDLPGEVMDEGARLFGFERQRMRRRVADTVLEDLIDCGTGIAGPYAATHLVTMSVVTLVRPEGNGSAIEMRVNGVARDRAVSSTPLHCVSKGRLEQIVARRIAQMAPRTTT